MNYPYPIPGTQADPRAFVADATLLLGDYDKPVDARSQITVDYSALIPAVTLTNFTLRVRPGGSPQLMIDQAALNTSKTKLTFMLSAGIGGRAYRVDITALLSTGERRTDMLNVNVSGDDCGCAPILAPPAPDGSVTGDGSVIVNDRPRFFVSAVVPVGARVLDRWYNTTTGGLYDYISNGLYSFWVPAGSSSSGGGGGGGGVGSNISVVTINPITPDGVTTIFTLTSGFGVVNIAASNTLFVSVDGVWQNAATQYVAAGNQIAFVQPPSADSVVFMLWFAPAP